MSKSTNGEVEARVRNSNSESFRRLNPELYAKTRINPVVHPVPSVQQKQDGVSSLETGKPRRERRKGRVCCVVTLIACRSREVDSDGNVAGLFHWRDAIAKSLNIDDGDKRVRWQYDQCETRGETGVMVRIEAV